VSGTDYDIIEQSSGPNNGAAIGSLGNGQLGHRGHFFAGLAMKNLTVANGAVYTVSFPMAMAKFRIYNSATAGVIGLTVGPMRLDPGSTLRPAGGLQQSNWVTVFTTPGSVLSSSAVQYWLSVTADGVTVVLNGDSGVSGRLCTAYVGSFTPIDSTRDVLPVMFSQASVDQTTATYFDGAMCAEFGYLRLQRTVDQSFEFGRDWQTKWMRSEWHGLLATGVTNDGSYPSTYWNPAYVTDHTAAPANGAASQPSRLGAFGFPSGVAGIGASSILSSFPLRQAHPDIDGKWPMYGFSYYEGEMGGLSETGADETRRLRGTQTTRFLYIPSDGWASGDELTDSGTGVKYFLLMPDRAGAGGRKLGASTAHGGAAIVEV
jgi:hypothetical protein